MAGAKWLLLGFGQALDKGLGRGKVCRGVLRIDASGVEHLALRHESVHLGHVWLCLFHEFDLELLEHKIDLGFNEPQAAGQLGDTDVQLLIRHACLQLVVHVWQTVPGWARRRTWSAASTCQPSAVEYMAFRCPS